MAIGLCLGLVGAGGSILTIPVFVYILKTEPVTSTVYSMFIVGICSLAGSIRSFFKGFIDVKVALLFGVPSVTGVFIARKLIFPALPQKVFCVWGMAVSKNVCIMLCLAAIMLVVSIKMLKKPVKNAATTGNSTKNKTFLVFCQGMVTGIITGLLGVGGGFLIMPALLLWLKLPVKTAIGTALLIITINSFTGFITSYNMVHIEWSLLVKFATGAIAGILVGTKLSEKIHPGNLKIALGWFIIATSIYVLYTQFKICIKL